MATNRTKLALLGCGGIVGGHRPGYDQCSDVAEVVAVAEPREERHAFIREAFGEQVRIVPEGVPDRMEGEGRLPEPPVPGEPGDRGHVLLLRKPVLPES